MDTSRLRAQMEEFQAKLQQEGKLVVTEGLKELFGNHPTLQQFSWEGYTPYFNDGDECVYGLYGGYAKLVPVPEGCEEDSDYGIDISWVSDKKKEDPAVKECAEVYHALESIRSILKTIFGDHCRVVASRADGGISVETEEVEHD